MRRLIRAVPTKDPRVDVYIAKSGDFAKLILNHLRALAQKACPQVQETIKWGMPFFLFKGILFGMAAFKQHCTLHFWNGKLVLGQNSRKPDEGSMGQFGRITSLSDLPAKKVLLGYMKKAAQLNEAGIKKEPSKPKPGKKLVVPAYFIAALATSEKARATFENFSPSHQREYVEWITEAKRDETRARRIATMLEWLAKGKPRNWKYLNC
jgi:uncharacterized protein YdeI (YjbR/CyaY-like superfamily)